MVMSTKEHSLLVEKYRSKDLTEYVGNEHIKTQIQKYLDQDDIQNFIFYGPAGTGKTTLAKLIVNNLDCDYLYINASDERGIETIRDKVTSFSSTASFKKIKVVILDEADFLTIQAQASLRNTIETFSRTTRFILTCNFIERIIDPLQSRCQTLKIIPPSKKEIAKHLKEILDTEQTRFKIEDLANIVNKHHPDIRKMLNTIQLSTKDNELVLDESILVSSNYIKQIIDELKQKKTDFRKLRQIIADSQVRDFEELYRALFDHASEYAIGREGSVAIILNEHQYHSNFRIDKEVNIASALAKIIEIKKPQVI
jgi:DNA polymerase III delta prime subunit